MSFFTEDIFFPANAGGVNYVGANHQNMRPGEKVPE